VLPAAAAVLSNKPIVKILSSPDLQHRKMDCDVAGFGHCGFSPLQAQQNMRQKREVYILLQPWAHPTTKALYQTAITNTGWTKS